MADNIVALNNHEENIFEFELSIKGLDPKKVDAKFVIHSADMDLAFACTEGEDGKWQVKLPPLPMLETTMYPFHFAVVAENHHFTPLEGSLNVVGSRDVYVTTPKKKLASPIKPIEEKKEVKPEMVIPKAQPVRGRERTIEQIAAELMENAKPTAKPVEKAPPLLKETPVIETKKEDPVIVETAPAPILPTVAIEKKEEKKGGEKDEAALRVLEELGIRKTPSKPKSRFSILK